MSGMFEVKARDLGIRDMLKRAGKLSTANLTIGFERVGIRWLKFVDDGFKQERDPFGTPWAPLAKRTIRKKKALGYSKPERILVGSGEMRRSWSYHATSKSVSLRNSRSFPDGTDASIHQFGGQAGKFTIPARPMVPFEQDLPGEWWDAAINSLRYAVGRYMSNE